jgi:7-alpha-hydroxysteroid dehydrogenase
MGMGCLSACHSVRMMILDRFRLDDKVVIVTGAGRGIGASIARTFASVGADLVLAARTAEQLEEVAADVREAGRTPLVLPCDVSDLDALAPIVDQAVDRFGGVDVVVNNVGGSMPGPFLDTSVKAFEGAFHFNVTTAFRLTQLAVPHMLGRENASVVNISSAMGRLTDRGFAAYGTAKGALSHLTRLLAADLAPRVRVNGIAVGSVATSALEVVLDNQEIHDEMVRRTPLRRLGDPEDIAAAALWLASPAGSWVTGKVVEVDGGLETPNLAMGLPDL